MGCEWCMFLASVSVVEPTVSAVFLVYVFDNTCGFQYGSTAWGRGWWGCETCNSQPYPVLTHCVCFV